VERDAADPLERDTRRQVDRAHATLRGDAEMRQELRPRKAQVLDRRDQSDVRLLLAEKDRNAGGGCLPQPEYATVGPAREPPRERPGVDERDRGDSQVFHRVAMTFAGAGQIQGGAFYQKPSGSQSARDGDRPIVRVAGRAEPGSATLGAHLHHPGSDETADSPLSLSSLYRRDRGVPRPGPVVAHLGPLLFRTDPAASPDPAERLRPGIDLGPRSPPDRHGGGRF